jgi:hypothetical protein
VARLPHAFAFKTYGGFARPKASVGTRPSCSGGATASLLERPQNTPRGFRVFCAVMVDSGPVDSGPCCIPPPGIYLPDVKSARSWIPPGCRQAAREVGNGPCDGDIMGIVKVTGTPATIWGSRLTWPQIGCLRSGVVLPQHRDDLLFGERFRLIISPFVRPYSNFAWRKTSVAGHIRPA